jgi:hypothetical protein
MSPIDDFLRRVEKRLLVRRRYRREIIEEMRGHLEALQAERDTAFVGAGQIEKVFGEPRTLARRINASVPWTQARLPLTLLAIGPAAMVLLGIVSMPVFAVLDGWFDDSLHGAAAYFVFMAVTWLVYWAGPAAAMVCSIRFGARASHARLAVLCPSLIFALAVAATWLVRTNAGVWENRFGEVVGALSFLAISALLARVATVESVPLGRVRLALLLVTAASGTVCMALSPLPVQLMTITAPLGMFAAMAVLALLLPRLARRDPVVA